jgi:hypothetical protein
MGGMETRNASVAVVGAGDYTVLRSRRFARRLRRLCRRGGEKFAAVAAIS